MNDIKRLAQAIEDVAAAIRTERATPQWIPYREPYVYPGFTFTCTSTSGSGTRGITPDRCVSGGAHQQ